MLLLGPLALGLEFLNALCNMTTSGCARAPRMCLLMLRIPLMLLHGRRSP